MKNINKRSLWILIGFLVLCLTAAYAAPEPAAEDNIQKLTKKVFPSVVKVEARDGWRKVATGVVIHKDGYIVTTALVSPREDDFCVITPEGVEIEAEFLGMDPETHLGLVKAKEGKWTPITMGKVEDLSPGSEIAVVCYSPEEKAAITKGIVSSIGVDSLRLNVVVIPGASGSPVVDMEGRMVGIVRGAYVGQVTVSVPDARSNFEAARSLMLDRVESSSSGMAFAVPVDIVEKVTTEIKETGKVRRGWLGVSLGLTRDGEVVVSKVTEESPAEDAGLQVDDIILEIDGEEVTDRDQLAKEIRMHKPGDEVTLKVDRDGSDRNIEVELGEYSDRAIMQEFEYKFPELFQVRPDQEGGVIRVPESGRVLGFFQTDRKYIGVSIQEVNPELAEFFGVEDGAGLLINKVEEDSPAAKAGLKVGDVIVRADGKVMKTGSRLERWIQEQEEGDKLSLEVVRDKRTRTISVEVAVEKGKGRRFFPEMTESKDSASRLFRDAFRTYQDSFGSQLGLFYKKNAEESQKRALEARLLFEKQARKSQEQRKQAEKNLRKALERYRCIEV
jgi:serine protease Do